MTLARFRATTVPARVRHVPGVFARRLAQLGPPALLQRLLKLRSHDAAFSVELLLHELAADGELDQLLQYWIKRNPIVLHFRPDSFATAALNGHVDVVDWMRQNCPPASVTASLVQQVATLGHRDVAEYLQRAFSLAEEDLFHEEKPLKHEESPSPRPTESTSNAAGHVMQSPILLTLIYSFRPRPAQAIRELEQLYKGEQPVEDVRGLLMRLALVQGELSAVKLVHTAAELTRFVGAPKLSLASAMHDAAVEGRMDALVWLHKRPGVACCRPDTMAAAVRAGWSDVVQWLHANAPESAASMSVSPLVDAAQWGFLEVLRTCYDLKITDAIADVNAPVTWSQAVLDAAIVNGHTQVVYWCARAFRLVGSSSAVKQAITDGHLDMLRILHREHALATHSIDGAIVQIAGSREMTKLVQFAVKHRLLSCAAADQVAQRILVHSIGMEDVLRSLLVQYPENTELMLLQAVQLENQRALSIILDSDSLSRQSLARSFQLAATERCLVALQILMDRGVHNACGNALSLLAALGQLEWVQTVFPGRTRDQSIAALEQATSLEIVSFLVRNEDQYYTEEVLMANLSSPLRAAFIRYLLTHKRRQDPSQIRCFADVLDQDTAPLTLDEINHVRLVQDPALDALLLSHYSTVPPPVESTSTNAPTLLIYQYLHAIGVVLSPKLLDAAIARGDLDEVVWLVRIHGLSDQAITPSSVRSAALKVDHFPVLQFLHDHDQTKHSHSLRLGIRLAYEDVLTLHDDATATCLVELGADDLGPLQLVRVADEGHAQLATALARDTSSDTVIEAISRSAERGHFQVALALIDARKDIQLEMALRVRLAGFASRDGDLAAARALLGSTPPGKRSKTPHVRPYKFVKKRRTTHHR